MSMDQALRTFITEAQELLSEMEDALLGAGRAGAPPDMVNAIFRAAHTIKGSAGLFSLDHIVAFTHVVESVLDEVRDGTVALDSHLVSILLECSDHIGALVAAVEQGQLEGSPELDAVGASLLVQLHACMPATATAAPMSVAVQAPQAAPQQTVERIDGEDEARRGDYWHISLVFGRDVLRNGMDPASFIRYLAHIGRIVAIATIPDSMPEAADMDPESCYLGFEIAFDSQADKATIEAVFEFVHDDCAIRILPPNSRVSEYIALLRDLPEHATRVGDMLVACGAITERELESALVTQSDAAQDPVALTPKLGSILVGSGNVQPAVVEAALAKQKPAAEARASESRSIRVDADKLDHLINLVGELIIAGARTSLIAQRMHNAELQESTSMLAALVEDVRDSALQLRMVKIGATFNRFQRVVHDVSREIGKDIVLAVSGEDAELDKTVVERIADPLTHLVRNAIDHGIEPAEVRMERGKPAQGTVRLNAFHDSGSIVIEVSDDGGGLKKERILAKAIERGLVEAERKLTDSEIFALIFEPGFSTAEAITNLSGRGVGMDVVKRNIEALRGSVGIASVEGSGTTVSVRLPLTLAIIDSFLVALGKSVFVIPIDQIEECVEFSCEPGHDYTNLRGEVLPFVRLRDLFMPDAPPPRRESIVVVHHAGVRAGLVVDGLLGQFQTVIKPLSPVFAGVKCISGSTILGGGEVALILDIPAMLAHVKGRDLAPLAA
jgi:two-component system chemotaxis sensor kinase CheA